MEKLSIAKYLLQKGFNKVVISTNRNALLLARFDDNKAHMIYIMNADVKESQLPHYFEEMNQYMAELMRQDAKVPADVFGLVLGSHSEPALNYCRSRNNCWYLDKLDSKIYLYDNQYSDYCGIRYGMEQFIENNGVVFPFELTKEHVESYCIPAIVISVLCILVFLLFHLNVLEPKAFMLNAEALFQKKEWYRLFTYQFSHLEISHLMMNLLMLNVISNYAEHYYGKIKMLAVYLLSGITAGIFSMCFSVYTMNPYDSLGASGAIYGLIGMTLFQIMINWRKFNGNFFRRLIMAVVLIVIGSFYSAGVDHIAHLGGFLGGYILGAVLTIGGYWKSKRQK